MRVLYYSKPFFSDCDFPLVKALQEAGIDVQFYMSLPGGFKHHSILEFNHPFRKMFLIKASSIPDMQKYRNCLDLNRLYFIPEPSNRLFKPLTKLIWRYAIWHMKKQKADVFHFTWPFFREHEKMIYRYYCSSKKIMTVHDPIAHSGCDSDLEESLRIKAFSWADYFLLLNKVQENAFVNKYAINRNHLYLSHLGPYDIISKVKVETPKVDRPYILFFGQIAQYKGLEYLLSAMRNVHKKCPSIKLIIAGGGKLYFNAEEFKHLEYIEWRYRFIKIGELAGLLDNALFSVCPYTDATQSGVVNTSLAMNCPLIVTDVGDLPNMIKDGVNGLVVPPRNIESLSKAIIRLVEDKDTLSGMKTYIRNQNMNNNEWDNIAKEYIDIYNTISLL